MIIENVPGADTKLGLTKAWRAKPDGSSLIYINPPGSILKEYISKTEYITKEFVPIYNFLTRSAVLCVNAENYRNVEEFMKVARAGRSLAILKFSGAPIAGFENVPSPKDLGYPIPMISGLGGIVAPPKTPPHVIKFLEAAFEKTAKDQEFLTFAQRRGYDLLRLSAKDFKKQLLDQYSAMESDLDILKQLGAGS